ncbi:hypothetical protein MNEG_14827, partial [Monoraphidium neglectum]
GMGRRAAARARGRHHARGQPHREAARRPRATNSHGPVVGQLPPRERAAEAPQPREREERGAPSVGRARRRVGGRAARGRARGLGGRDGGGDRGGDGGRGARGRRRGRGSGAV